MIKNFKQDESGSFAVYFAVALSVILLGVSIAIDVSGMHKQRVKYQDMSDAAVLAAAKSRPKTEASMETVAKSVVDQLSTAGTTPSTNAILSADKKVLQVHLDGTYKSMMMGMFGKSRIPIQVMSETLIEVVEYTDIVLVLDTTRSMNYEGRLPALKNSVNNFIDVIADIDSDNVNVAVVPYGQYVNVGTEYRQEPWVYVPEDWEEPRPDICTTTQGPVTSTSCETRYTQPRAATPYQPGTSGTSPTYGTCYDDGVAYSCQTSPGTPGTPATPAQPADPGGEPYEHCTNTYGPSTTTCVPQDPILHTWYGVVGSRAGNLNVKPSWVMGEGVVPGYLDLQAGQSILPLTKDMGTVRAKINSLSVSGLTYIPAGLIWGWRMLEPSQPFPNPANLPAGARHRKVMIFMTDGLNTVSRDGQNHTGSSRAEADDTTEELCEGINDADYEVYSITFKVIDNAARDMVRDCATKPGMYFNAANASQLHDAFNDIGLSLLTPRLTQ